MRVLFLILIFFSSFNLCSQTYDAYVIDAKALYQAKAYKESAILWDKAFQMQPGFASDYYNAACTVALGGHTQTAFDYLEQAISYGWEDIAWLQQDPDLSGLKESANWSVFKNAIPALKTDYLNSLNLELKNQLEDLRMQDQTIRLLLPDAETRFGRESKAYNWFRNELMPRNDSLVLNRIITLIEEKGWPGIQEVGELANQTLWLVIQHAPLEIQKKYLPLLEASVAKGESKARYLAFLQDRILMREDQKQIYGTQSLWDNTKKQNVIWPILNPENVNQRRKAVGLEPIEAYAEANGFLYIQE
ncbi:DUF6624 domain-containing protein [Leeuwenhoekiella marinoflava]|uniref:DUF6624 domain-containing protein n=1 Tax=Leeuwenhoekiella marinoflava TaxID=988 RepID=UPI0030036BA8